MKVLSIESPVRKYINEPDQTSKILERVRNDFESVEQYFNDKNEQRKQNLDFYAGRQWSDAEITAHEEQNRNPFVFNEIQHKVDHLIGTQTQTRFDVKVMPREAGDEEPAQLLNSLVKWVEQVNNLEYIEKESFMDMLIGGGGVAQVRWEMEDIDRGYPVIEKIPANEVFWDANSKIMDLSDARWIGRLTYMSRMDAIELFPEYEEEIQKANATYRNGTNFARLVYTHKQEEVFDQIKDEESRELVEVVEYYERAKIYLYVVHDDIAGKSLTFDNYKKAKAYYNGLIDKYTETGELLIHDDGSPKIGLVTNSTNAIFQTIIVGDQVISYEQTALHDFPYVVGFGYFHEGDYWGFVDSMIDPQILINRFFSQWDYQVGASAKNVVTVVPSLLRRDYGMEYLREELSKTAPIIPLLRHDALQFQPNQQVNPELFQAIQFGISRMTDYAGGRNALGLQENAAESGRAVIARAEQGGLARLPLFDQLRFFRLQLTYRIIWYLKNFMPPQQVIRIIGQDDRVSYVELDDQTLKTLRELKVDVLVDEAVKSDSVKERYFQQFKELFQVMPGLPPEIVTKIMLEFSNVPRSVKEEIINSLDFYKTYQQEQAEQQKMAKLENSVKDSLTKRQIKEEMMAQEELTKAKQETEKASGEFQRAAADADNDMQEAIEKQAELMQAQGNIAEVMQQYEQVENEKLGAALQNSQMNKLSNMQ